MRGLWKSLRALVRPGAVESELSDELAFHIEMETEKNVRAGLSRAEARRRALVSFRGVERYKEEVRAARRTRGLETLGQDVGWAARTIRRAPGLTAVVVLTLGIGIGATTAIFGIVDGAVLRPLPWPDPDALVLVRETTPEGQPFTLSEPNYLDFRAAESLTALAAFREIQPTLELDGDPARVRGLAATHTIFPMLGASAAHGRTFNAEEDAPGGDGRVVVLSHGLWRDRFGEDPAVVGARIPLDGEPHTVVGVMPATFELFEAELWVPLSPDVASDRGDHWLDVIGRLAPGSSADRAAAELAGISRSLAETHPKMRGWGVEVRGLRDAVVGPEFKRASLVLAVAVGLLLLMACANVANLLLAHGTARQTDLGVRAALGAGRGRIVRQLLAEAGILSLGGAVLGLGLAVWAVAAVRTLSPESIPRVAEIGVDLRVLAFAALVALATALLAGALPALQAGRTSAASQLKAGRRTGPTRGQRRLREALVVGQVALSVVLLLGAGLMIRSFAALQAVDPGFRTDHVWAVPLPLPEARYGDETSRFFAYRDIMEAVGSVPGVAGVAGSFVDPFSGMNASNDVTPAERAAEFPDAGFMQAPWRIVTPSYFETMDVPLLRGRTFTAADRYGTPGVVVVTRSLAERLWPGRDAVGERLYWGGTDGETRTVIGVVGDIRDVRLDGDAPGTMFLTYRQLVLPMLTLLVRADGPVAGLPGSIRRAIRSVDPALAVPDIRPLARSRAAVIAGPRFHAQVLAVFAAVSLALAAVGLYGLLAFLVARRTREIGVRRALGAHTGAVSGMIVRRGLALATAGIALGLGAALLLGRFVEAVLFRTGTTDPLTFAVVPLLFVLVAAGAAWIPARRAAHVEPIVALRGE